jgi:hypothetical protein
MEIAILSFVRATKLLRWMEFFFNSQMVILGGITRLPSFKLAWARSRLSLLGLTLLTSGAGINHPTYQI